MSEFENINEFTSLSSKWCDKRIFEALNEKVNSGNCFVVRENQDMSLAVGLLSSDKLNGSIEAYELLVQLVDQIKSGQVSRSDMRNEIGL